MLENNHTIHLTLNGESRAFTVEPQETLLHVLRERAHLTGAKKGCDLGECGACTVIMDGRAVNSCCVFAIEADGSTVETIEGIGTADEPHPLQQAFIDAGAIQCGYCTPGMIMAAKGPTTMSRSEAKMFPPPLSSSRLPPNIQAHWAMRRRNMIAPAMVAATVEMSVSRCLMWESSWAMTPLSS